VRSAQAAARKPLNEYYNSGAVARPHPAPQATPLSAWSRSGAKRFFDVALVVASLPIVAPACLLIAIAIRISSRGPVFFVQRRVGLHGAPFSIVKFRTMTHRARGHKICITTIRDDQITSVGRVLRALKLDELPQFFNVLRGEMSLVGPRPRVPKQPLGRIDCRPGITGAASLAFAREEMLLAGIPAHQLPQYYASRVIPLKQRLDEAYMLRATFVSDLNLLFLTVFKVWLAPSLRQSVEKHGAVGALPEEGCD
jgi:lipopolysaccharide/colanic/teichoic acid biosynthesis glycosyltransferase